MLVVLSGLPGSGKTTLARELARVLGAPLVRLDAFEVALGVSAGTEGYRVAHVAAGDALRSGRHVVVDAVNPVREARDGWRALAAEVGVPVLSVFVVCGDAAEHERRVSGRTADLPGHVVPDWASVQALAARGTWCRADDEPPGVVTDTSSASVVDIVTELAARVASHPEQVATPASLIAPTHRFGEPGRPGEVVLETERLLLRRWRATDLEPFAAMGHDPRVMEHFPGLLDRPASDGLARYADACFEVCGFGLSVLERRDDGAFLGFCGMHRHRRRPHQVEVGWRLARSAWGHGYATEAGRAWLEAAPSCGVARVECYVAPANTRSLAVAGRLGLSPEHEEEWDGRPVVVLATPAAGCSAGISPPRAASRRGATSGRAS